MTTSESQEKPQLYIPFTSYACAKDIELNILDKTLEYAIAYPSDQCIHLQHGRGKWGWFSLKDIAMAIFEDQSYFTVRDTSGIISTSEWTIRYWRWVMNK